MDTIRFTVTDKNQQQFAGTLKKRVAQYFRDNGLSTKANAAMIFKTVALISMYIIPFICLLTIEMDLWLAFLLVVIMGIGIAGVGMGVMHDACHGAYSRKQWVNNLLAGTLYLLGSNVLNWKIQHNVLHHTYTNISGYDEDIDSKGPIRLSEHVPLKKMHRYQFLYAFFFYGLMTIVMLTNDFTRLYKYSKLGLLKGQNKKLQKEFIQMLIRKLIYLGVIFGLPLWLTSFSFWQVLAGFFIMHWVASIILSFVFQMAHVVEGAEQPVAKVTMQTEWHVHQMNTTSDFARHNRLLSWYVGGLNFQVEHHLFPGICHIHYKALAPIVQQTAQDYGIAYHLQPTFRSALLSHIYRLKALGKQ